MFGNTFVSQCSVTFIVNSTNQVVLVCHCNCYSHAVIPQLWRSTCRRPLEMCWRSSTAFSWSWEEMLRWRERERWGPTGFWERSRRAIEIVKMRETHALHWISGDLMTLAELFLDSSFAQIHTRITVYSTVVDVKVWLLYICTLRCFCITLSPQALSWLQM